MKLVILVSLALLVIMPFCRADSLAVSQPNKNMTLDANSITVRNPDGSFTKAIYSGTVNVVEGGTWKPIEQAKSLMGQPGLTVSVFPTMIFDNKTNTSYADKEFVNVSIIDFNFTSISFKIVNSTALSVTFKKNGIVTGEKLARGGTFSVSVSDNIFANNFSFGENSTNVILQNGNDDSGNAADVSDNGEGDTTCYSNVNNFPEGVGGSKENQSSYNKWNISSVPAGMVIDNAILGYYVYTNSYEGSDQNTSLWGIDNQTWWETSSPSACSINFYSKVSGPATFIGYNNTFGTSVNTWLIWNVTTWLNSMYQAGRMNVTFVENGTSDLVSLGDQLYKRPRHYSTANLRPFLNITYSSPPTPPSAPPNVTYKSNTSVLLALQLQGGKSPMFLFFNDNIGYTPPYSNSSLAFVGQTYFEIATGKIWIYNGTAWVYGTFSGSGGVETDPIWTLAKPSYMTYAGWNTSNLSYAFNTTMANFTYQVNTTAANYTLAVNQTAGNFTRITNFTAANYTLAVNQTCGNFSVAVNTSMKSYVDNRITNLSAWIITVNSTNGQGGGSQTPWTSDIDAAHYNLTNLDGINDGMITFTTTGVIDFGDRDARTSGPMHSSHVYATNLVNSGRLLIANVGGVQEGSGPYDTGSNGLGASTGIFDSLTFSSSDPEVFGMLNVTQARALQLARASCTPAYSGALWNYYNGTAMIYFKPLDCQFRYFIDDDTGWHQMKGDIRSSRDTNICYNINTTSFYAFDPFNNQTIEKKLPILPYKLAAGVAINQYTGSMTAAP
jgi:hypothetical protein